MRRSSFFLLPILALQALAAAPLDDEHAAQVAAARAILDPWHAKDPEPADRKLHLVYWNPSDREPCENHQVRLTRMMEHIQGFYAAEMQRLGFGPRSIKLDYEANGSLRIHVVKGAGPFADYGKESGRRIRKECLPVLKAAGIDAERETILIFCNLATWDPEKLTFKHRSPYYASGSHREGTAWQLDSPELDTLNMAKTEPMMRDGEYGRISLGKHNSIFIGGIAHELGHALSLPHNREHPAERRARGIALMGSGNRSYGDEIRKEGKGSFLTLAHALRLASHPQFSGSVKGMNQAAQAKFSGLSVKVDGKSFHLSGKVDGTVPVYAIVAYCDPEGRGDYDALTATAIPDKDGKFSLHCPSLAPGKAAELRLVACHVNGSSTGRGGPRGAIAWAYRVNQDGTPDLSRMQQQIALSPLVEAINARRPSDIRTASEAIHALGDPHTSEITRSLVSSLRRRQEPLPPAKIQGPDSIALTATKPGAVKVGWGRPTYDRVPDPSLLLKSGGRIFATGIYAHAPATHTYDLGGQWNELSGFCGLADGHSGSVVFVLRGDGKELWRSNRTKTGQVHRYKVDLTGIKTLRLLTEDGGDGASSDWGLWLEPTLSR